MDRQIKKDIHLAARIIRYLKGTLSPEKEKAFREEIENDETLRTFVEKINRESFFDQKIKDYHQINIHEKWQKHLAARSSAGKTHRLTGWPKLILRVAAVLLPFLIATTFYYAHNKKPSGDIPGVAVNQPLIMPGSNKAVLTLSNGSRIILDKAGIGTLAKEGNTQIIKSEDGKLVYNDSLISKFSNFQINTLSTPRGGQHQLSLSDGTRVWLNAASSIRFPASFIGNERRVEIHGEAYFEVAKNEGMPFIVNVKNKAEVKVLGTHFNISAYDDETVIRTTLLEGSVEVSSSCLPDGQVRSFSPFVLKPGEQAILDTDGKLTVASVDPYRYTAWKDGRLAFKDEALENIIKRMARWYDFEAVYADPSLKNLCFTGNIERKASVEEVLHLLGKTERITFHINRKTITIMKEP